MFLRRARQLGVDASGYDDLLATLRDLPKQGVNLPSHGVEIVPVVRGRALWQSKRKLLRPMSVEYKNKIITIVEGSKVYQRAIPHVQQIKIQKLRGRVVVWAVTNSKHIKLAKDYI